MRNKLIPVLIILTFLSCTVTNVTRTEELTGIEIDYLLFYNETAAEEAVDLLFNAGFESEVERGYSNNKRIFLVELPQYSEMSTEEFLDLVYDENGKIHRFFPQKYHDKVITVIIEF